MTDATFVHIGIGIACLGIICIGSLISFVIVLAAVIAAGKADRASARYYQKDGPGGGISRGKSH